MSGWNYRIIRHCDPIPKCMMDEKHKVYREEHYPKGYMEWFAVHEVFYNNRGNPDGVTNEPIKVTMDEFTKKEFNWVMKHMKEAGSRPVLDYAYFEKQGEKKRASLKYSDRSNKKNNKGK